MAGSHLYKSAQILKDLINEKWSLSKKPQVALSWEEKTVGFMDDREDSIIIYALNEVTDYFGLYAQDFFHTLSFKIDAYTYQNQEYHQNFTDELFRIFKENVKSSSYILLVLTASSSENDIYRNIFKHNFAIDIKVLNP